MGSIMLLLGVALIILAAILVLWLWWGGTGYMAAAVRPSPASEVPEWLGANAQAAREALSNDAYLQRLLMIEIVGNNGHLENPSTEVTSERIAEGMGLIGRTMARSLGGTIAQRLTILFNKRADLIREYYQFLRRAKCSEGTCVHTISLEDIGAARVSEAPSPFSLSPKGPTAYGHRSTPSPEGRFAGEEEREKGWAGGPEGRLTPSASPNHSRGQFVAHYGEARPENLQPLDITNATRRKLEEVAREISDSIASSFQIRDMASGERGVTRIKRPLIHFQRLYNLVTMYDRELINQARAYVVGRYDVSMNHSQGAVELAQHISDELAVLMRDGYDARLAKTP